MKQCKFKCPICGKWHDIYVSWSGAIAMCDVALKTSHKPIYFDDKPFRVVQGSLQRLLNTLRNLNIEVAEVCDKLRWSYNKGGWFQSQEVIRGSKLGRYYIELITRRNSNSTYECIGFDCNFTPSKEYDGNVIEFGCFNIEKAAKAACQADFEKRRAK